MFCANILSQYNIKTNELSQINLLEQLLCIFGGGEACITHRGNLLPQHCLHANDKCLDNAFFKACSHLELIHDSGIELSYMIGFLCLSFRKRCITQFNVNFIIRFCKSTKCQHNLQYLFIRHDDSLVLEICR